VTRVPWGWIGTTAGVLAITYVGAHYAGVPVPWPGSPAAVASLDGETGQRLHFPVRLNGSGIVQPWSTIDIRTRIDGQIEKIAFEEGQMVKKGDLLVQIDPRPFQAALDQALSRKSLDEAQLANSKGNLTRYKTLGTNNLVSQQEIDTQGGLVNQQEAQIKADQGVIENAQVQLSYTNIIAPIAGRMGAPLVDEGQLVSASQTRASPSLHKFSRSPSSSRHPWSNCHASVKV
jgi:membrane fusion protein, multidrug efflux system